MKIFLKLQKVEEKLLALRFGRTVVVTIIGEGDI